MRFEYADGRMPVAMTRGDSTYYLTYDQVGSLRVVADSTGNVVKTIEYDSFGNIIGVGGTDPSFEVPFGLAGGLHDRDTGLVRFGYRDYDPDIGRWTAKDPIFFAGGDVDLYGYCLNDPVNLVDPNALFSEKLISHASSTWGGIIAGGPGALVGGVIGGVTGGALGGVPGAIIGGTAGGVIGSGFDSPSAGQLNYHEDLMLEHYYNMQEIEELEKQVEELRRGLEPMLEKFHIDSDRDDPCG